MTDPTGHRECGAHDGCSGEALPSLPTPPPPLGDPLEGFYDSGYDYDPTRPDVGGYHNGVDLGNDKDTSDDLFAIAEGRVRVTDACTVCGYSDSANANFGAGNVVIIEYIYDVIPANIREALGLKRGDSVYVQYQHLASINESITVGQEVQPGDVVGQYGNTGLSKGVHLHLEVHIGTAGALGRGPNSTPGNSYNIYNTAWHELSLVDPGLIWNIPQPPS